MGNLSVSITQVSTQSTWGCICSDFQGHGRLQCLCLGDQSICSEQVVFDSECNRCKCGSEGVLLVQGCGEGCAAVTRSRSSSELLTLGHGRTVRNYSKLSSGMHFPVHSQMGINSCHSTSAHAQYLFF